MNIEETIQKQALESVKQLYGAVEESQVQIQKTRREIEGDYTLVVFPLLRLSKKAPEQTANEIGELMIATYPHFKEYSVIKGFLNLTLDKSFWTNCFNDIRKNNEFGMAPQSGKTVMVEYSSPNTNKPLHLGHIRNNLLGYSVAEILKANGHNVIKVNLVNDRGIHICKSMLAWQKYGNGETPESSGMKGDHLVGKYYVEFDKHYRQEIKELVANGMSEEEAKTKAPSIVEAQEMLRQWEAKEPSIIDLWQRMNGWVYEGFDKTYKDLGVDFDKIYYESDTYILGKDIVDKGLAAGVFYRREDGSVWIDLSDENLDEKLLLRSDGTSVYMTQDLGTAYQRFEEYNLDDMIYVVGNEQIYHFQVLKVVLEKLGHSWAKHIFHLSYGMVELPDGKMKSREGTVVDADDLIAEMIDRATEMSLEHGRAGEESEDEVTAVGRMVGLGALKYFLLKVDPRRNMLFAPEESIDFNGNTGPFIQYTHARIRSILRRANEAKIDYNSDFDSGVEIEFLPEEIELIKDLVDFPLVIIAAGEAYSPALISTYVYDLAKSFNGYYHDHSILGEEDENVKKMRLQLAEQVARVISKGMRLLGIDVPERM